MILHAGDFVARWDEATAASSQPTAVVPFLHPLRHHNAFRPGNRGAARKKLACLCAYWSRGYSWWYHTDDLKRHGHDGRGFWVGAGECTTNRITVDLVFLQIYYCSRSGGPTVLHVVDVLELVCLLIGDIL